ncbi:MAG: hypothetical protein A3B96_04520 [Candidatus Spechtbacteria bacterium RIFCSPHIGHO2_02_FULL_43_15b]|nr:MAG: hypothetical protein A3B96_04520 [Candidatus Spechtbacteria bacterium RIFCSPHIGHO2_02_FULL_43_15b]
MKFKLKRETISVTFILLAIVFFAAFLLYAFEKNENEFINSYWDALWLSAVTASSVGYGDIYPITAGGKVVSSLLGFTGLILIGATSALFTAYLFGRGKR